MVLFCSSCSILWLHAGCELVIRGGLRCPGPNPAGPRPVVRRVPGVPSCPRPLPLIALHPAGHPPCRAVTLVLPITVQGCQNHWLIYRPAAVDISTLSRLSTVGNLLFSILNNKTKLLRKKKTEVQLVRFVLWSSVEETDARLGAGWGNQPAKTVWWRGGCRPGPGSLPVSGRVCLACV